MSKTGAQQRHFLISKPHLLDVVDEDWMKDTLPDDGGCVALIAPQSAHSCLAICI